MDEIRRIPGRDATFFLEHARFFAAAMAPDLLPSIPFVYHGPRHLDAEGLSRIMIEHGNLEAAMELTMRNDDASTFPFSIAGMLMERVSEQERLALLRRAIEAWREAHGDTFGWLIQRFVWLFQHRWKILPEEEARDVVRDIVRETLSEPDKATQSTCDQEGTIKITSFREQTLFQILHILRHLDQQLLELLLSSHPQFAAAAQRFPYGMESIQQEAEERLKSEGGRRTGFVIGGNPDDFPYLKALMQGSQNGDFEQAMEHAQQQYGTDSASENQNLVPREFWPSTSRFRSILYAAGKRLGEDARGTSLASMTPTSDCWHRSSLRPRSPVFPNLEEYSACIGGGQPRHGAKYPGRRKALLCLAQAARRFAARNVTGFRTTTTAGDVSAATFGTPLKPADPVLPAATSGT